MSAATAAIDRETRAARATRPAHVPGEPSMWFFVIGDLFIFAVYFVVYVVYRQQHHELFLSSQQHLNQGIGAINTVVLLTSSLFVALGTQTARLGKARDAISLFAIALAIGAIFPILKMVEWLPELGARLTPGHNLFFMFYYVMAGLHLCHVLLGLVIMCFVIRDLQVSKSPNMRFVETGATYWHMVDLLWLVLFALFYLMR